MILMSDKPTGKSQVSFLERLKTWVPQFLLALMGHDRGGVPGTGPGNPTDSLCSPVTQIQGLHFHFKGNSQADL